MVPGVPRVWFGLVLVLCCSFVNVETRQGQGPSPEEQARMNQQNAALRAMLQTATKFPLSPAAVPVHKPAATPDWAIGMVSWVAAAPDGTTYLLQRGDKADPVIALDHSGKILRSWGKGMYTMPHAIRVDPQGNVWTTDAASSMVYKFKNDGTLLMKIEVGGQPANCANNFCSTTDVAFARDGHLFISDGYRNARILEYSADGRKLNEWGTAGTGPGQFRLPHSIQIDENNIVYVADRENGRVQRFDRSGKFLGEWAQYGKTFGLALDGTAIWLSTIPRGPNSAPGWLIKLDRNNGRLLGYVDSQGNHGMAVMKSGELLLGPGPDQVPQRYSSQ
jgi:streptogramin lyase